MAKQPTFIKYRKHLLGFGVALQLLVLLTMPYTHIPRYLGGANDVRSTRLWSRLLGVQGVIVEDVAVEEDELASPAALVVAVRVPKRLSRRCGICQRRGPINEAEAEAAHPDGLWLPLNRRAHRARDARPGWSRPNLAARLVMTHESGRRAQFQRPANRRPSSPTRRTWFRLQVSASPGRSTWAKRCRCQASPCR